MADGRQLNWHKNANLIGQIKLVDFECSIILSIRKDLRCKSAQFGVFLYTIGFSGTFLAVFSFAFFWSLVQMKVSLKTISTKTLAIPLEMNVGSLQNSCFSITQNHKIGRQMLKNLKNGIWVDMFSKSPRYRAQKSQKCLDPKNPNFEFFVEW